MIHYFVSFVKGFFLRFSVDAGCLGCVSNFWRYSAAGQGVGDVPQCNPGLPEIWDRLAADSQLTSELMYVRIRKTFSVTAFPRM